jgi:hypothetical protein
LFFEKKKTFRGSSVAEQSAVNRLAVGSNPTRGAYKNKALKGLCFLFLAKFKVLKYGKIFYPKRDLSYLL